MKEIIDLHCHFNHGDEYDTKTNELYEASLDFLLKEHKFAGVNKTAFSTFSSVISSNNVVAENEYLHKVALETPNVFQWVVIDPRVQKTFEQAERMLVSNKVLGVKIHPPYHKYRIDDFADKIFSFANERNCKVLMHPDNIVGLPSFVDRYPKMQLILAHLGSMEHIEAIKNAKRKNIFTDTSGNASSKNNVIEYAVKTIGADRIYFGTDTYAVGFQLGRILFSRISDSDKEKILYKNALQNFSNLNVKI